MSFYRQNDGWSKLPTKHMGQSVGAEDGWYIHYLAETLGFSVFAVDVKIEASLVRVPLAGPLLIDDVLWVR